MKRETDRMAKTLLQCPARVEPQAAIRNRVTREASSPQGAV